MKYRRYLNLAAASVLVFDSLMVFAYFVYRWHGNDADGHPTYNITHAAWFQPSLISVLVVTAILVCLVLGFVITPAQTVLKSKQREELMPDPCVHDWNYHHGTPTVCVKCGMTWTMMKRGIAMARAISRNPPPELREGWIAHG